MRAIALASPERVLCIFQKNISMKYIIDFAKSFDKAQQFNASKKAPAAPMTFFDIEKVMGKVIGKKLKINLLY